MVVLTETHYSPVVRRRVDLLQKRAALGRPDADDAVRPGGHQHRRLATAGGLRSQYIALS